MPGSSGRIGYARISTIDQNSDLQEDALQNARCEKILRDVASSAVDSRKRLAEAIDYARESPSRVRDHAVGGPSVG